MYKEGKEWKEFVALLATQARPTLITGKVMARVDFYLKRDRDTHGSLKVDG